MIVDIDLSETVVLVVDDSWYARSFMRSALQSFGVRKILEAADALDGTNLLRDGKVDVALVDHDMEPLDGIQFTSMIRGGEVPGAQEVPIIMVAGSTEREVVLGARNAGVTEFLAKPVSAESLFRRIRNAVLYPKPFVRSSVYTGPCRRIMDREPPEGEERRMAPPLPKPEPLIVLPPNWKPASQKLQAKVHRTGQGAAAQPAAAPAKAPELKLSRRTFAAGTVIFQEGDPGDQAYVVEVGRVGIYKTTAGERVKLGQLGPNGVFGEMALIDGEPRMASAVAEDDSTCLILPKTALEAQLKKTPDLVIVVLETLLKDIRTLGRDLVQVRAALRAKR